MIKGREGKEAVAKKVDEDGDHGRRASVAGVEMPEGRESRVIESGWGVLDNNEVNFLMAVNMSAGAMLLAAAYWGVQVPKSLAGYGI